MKHYKIAILIISITLVTIVSCKTVGRIAAKYWLKREINEFISNCENMAGKIIGSEKAKKYCDCSVDLVAEEYHNYQDAKNLSLRDILTFVDKCK